MTFVNGEQVLSRWMGDNAVVSWIVTERPWELEQEFIATLDLPLNLDQNSDGQFHSRLTAVRAASVAAARDLAVLSNPGVGGR